MFGLGASRNARKYIIPIETGDDRPAREKPVSVDPALQRDIDAYCKRLDELLKNSSGKYVLFEGAKLVDVFDSYADALTTGYQKFGADTFLVQRVEPIT